MTNTLTIERDFHVGRRGHGARLELRAGAAPALLAPGRVPRVARLMALAIRFDGLLRAGVIADYRAFAELGHVTRGRVSQIMNLLNLAPDMQEALLFLPLTENGRDSIHLRQLQTIASVPDWRRQRRLWADLVKHSAARTDSRS